MENAINDLVGYRKPPKKNQFKPGQSGNPKGRPKGAINIANMVQQELDQKVSVLENGKRLRVSKRRLAARQQVNKAAQGDPKAFLAISRCEQAADLALNQAGKSSVPPQSELPDEQCLEIVKQWINYHEQLAANQVAGQGDRS